MSAQARETQGGIETIPVLGMGTLQTITEVGTGADVIFFDIGSSPAPDASTGNRLMMPPDVGMFWKCNPGDKVATHDGSNGGTITNAVGALTTVVYLYYSKAEGVCYVLECA